MNKGQSLMEVLVALLILSIVLVIIIGFIQTGRGVFNKGFQNILIKKIFIVFIRAYQIIISSIFGPCCRFYWRKLCHSRAGS